jgi:dihydroorotase
MKIHIKNGRVIDPASGLDAVKDLYIAAGQGSSPSARRRPSFTPRPRSMPGPGRLPRPGRPVGAPARTGLEYMATLESEMHAAAVGGITSLACPPDTDPPLDEPGLVEMLKFRAKNSPGPRVYPIGALTWKLQGRTPDRDGRTAMKPAASPSARPMRPMIDTLVLLRAMEYAYTFGFPVWLRPQDHHLAKDGVVHDGVVAARYGLPSIPVPAETVALQTILLLVRETGARVHLCRLSSRAAVEMVRRPRKMACR